MKQQKSNTTIVSQTVDDATTHGWFQADGQLGFIPRYDMGIELAEVEFDFKANSRLIPVLSQSPEFESALSYFLGKRIAYKPQPCVTPEFLDNLTPRQANVVYWAELDELRRHSKAVTFHLVAESIISTVQSLEDQVLTAFRLRQAIEVTWWGLYFSYGCNVAFSLIRRALDEHTGKYASIVCEPLEQFVRGWFSVDAARVNPTLLGEGNTHTPTIETLPENNLQIAKLRELAHFWTKQIAEEDPELDSVISSAMSASAVIYEYLNGWIHLTPLLVVHTVGLAHEQPALPEKSRILGEAAKACHVLMRHCLLSERWRPLSYLQPDRSPRIVAEIG